MVTGNRRDQELDIVLMSSKDGSIIRNLTRGFDQSLGFEFIITPGMRFNMVPWLSWAPSGDQIGRWTSPLATSSALSSSMP